MPKFVDLIDPLLEDPTISEILIDGAAHVYVEKKGMLTDVESPFENDNQLLEVLQELAATFGHQLNESYPIVDLRFSDGSRMHIVIPPISLTGPSVVLRKMSKRQMTTQDLLNYESMNEDMLEFIRACVLARLNICIAGGTGSGKTTVLNVLADMIPPEERLVVVQNMSELRFEPRRVVVLETRPPNIKGQGEITARDLVQSSIKMRPDRIILSEAHWGEVLDLFAAYNTGHDGGMFSLHATTPRDALARLEVMAGSANPTIPLLGIREMMASALDVIIQQERLPDGSRRIVKITEVMGLHGDSITLQDIFEFRQTGMKDGKVNGYFTPTGQIPRFINRFRDNGIEIDLQRLFSPK